MDIPIIFIDCYSYKQAESRQNFNMKFPVVTVVVGLSIKILIYISDPPGINS